MSELLPLDFGQTEGQTGCETRCDAAFEDCVDRSPITATETCELTI